MDITKNLVELEEVFYRAAWSSYPLVSYDLIKEHLGFDIQDEKRYLMRTLKRRLEKRGVYPSAVRGQGYYAHR